MCISGKSLKRLKNGKFKVEVIHCHNTKMNSLYLNDYRIGGQKPYAGGEVISSWNVSGQDLLRALGQSND